MSLERELSKFYLFVWLEWFIRLTLSSIVYACVISFVVTTAIYYNQGMQSLNTEVYSALFVVFKFWFAPLWGISVLIVLFTGLKHLFNKCRGGYMLILHTCEKEEKPQVIETIGLGDIIKVWRKWFMLLIWLITAEMVISVAFSGIFSSSKSLFEWFNIYVLYGFIVVAGYFSFMILSSKCKRIGIRKC